VAVAAAGEHPLMLDMGTGARYFGLDCDARGAPFRGACLVSHLHWDHVQGLPFFSPLRHEDTELVIYAPGQDDGRTPHEVLMSSICPPLFPIGLDEFVGSIEVREAPPLMRIGGFEVRSAPVPHIGPTNGYRITHGGRSVAYVSDHQQPGSSLRVDPAVADLCAGVDLLIHDAQYTPSEFARKEHWGHCTIEYAVWLAAQVGARRLAMYHHDPDRDDDLLDRLASEAHKCGSAMGVEVFAAAEGLTVTV
jgi:ribonuclease BN (tRNA processing enzyme)